MMPILDAAVGSHQGQPGGNVGISKTETVRAVITIIVPDPSKREVLFGSFSLNLLRILDMSKEFVS